MTEIYPVEELDEYDDNGTMPNNVETLAEAVVGHRIVKVEQGDAPSEVYSWRSGYGTIITLDNGKRVVLRDTDDCCAYTSLHGFFLNPELVDHVIMGVGTTDRYHTWHIYADYGDVLALDVGWSSGNPFYYGYGFDIEVQEIRDE